MTPPACPQCRGMMLWHPDEGVRCHKCGHVDTEETKAVVDAKRERAQILDMMKRPPPYNLNRERARRQRQVAAQAQRNAKRETRART